MGDQSAIEWTDATYNPIRARHRVTGKLGWFCIHVSAGCLHCYSEDMNGWRGNGVAFKPTTLKDVEVFLDETILTAPLRWKKPRKIFVCSMTDLFGEWVPDEWIDRVFAVMALADWHTFQVLTKRPERMRSYFADMRARLGDVFRAALGMGKLSGAVVASRLDDPRPLDNVWLGVSVENEDVLGRIVALKETPAAVRFVSVEPLLGPVNLRPWLPGGPIYPPLDWIIVGGESGPGARPCHIKWLRSVRDQAKAAGVPLFIKQMGSLFVTSYYDDDFFRITHRDRKGGDPIEWPEDLRVREFPR